MSSAPTTDDTPPAPVGWAVEGWDPTYGSPMNVDEELDQPEVDVNVEMAEDKWEPVTPVAKFVPNEVLFIDGVQRIDARLMLFADAAADPSAAICATYGAGAVRCQPRNAQYEHLMVERVLLAPGIPEASAPNISSGVGIYKALPVASSKVDALGATLNEHMRRLERKVADMCDSAPLMILDGPLGGTLNIEGAIGYVKTHRQSYLPDPLGQVVRDLTAGQRTPLFVTKTSYTRYSWYLRLPGIQRHAMWGIIRCEIDGHTKTDDAITLANWASAALPRYASEAHRDPRAPQNLAPIGALESQLKHLLGDKVLIERVLKEQQTRV
jgi:hypothetical protein